MYGNCPPFPSGLVKNDGSFSSAEVLPKNHPECKSLGSFGRVRRHIGCTVVTVIASSNPFNARTISVRCAHGQADATWRG
jgi:hypothetical protein